MKIAVITPYYDEPISLLMRCNQSVINQTYKNVTHILVSDGDPCSWCDSLDHIQLPKSHADAGATPRAIGALSAFSLGYDAVAFLDADNWYEPNHIQEMIDIMKSNDVDMVTATRKIFSRNNELLYIDKESNGKDFADTNCLFFNRKILHLLPYWVTEPKYKMVSDRAFWQACLHYNVKKTQCITPTVCYSTKWATHYQLAGKEIPEWAIWMEEINGIYVTTTHKEKFK